MRLNGKDIQLVIFDLDGTLTSVKSSWEYVHRQLGLWDNCALDYHQQFLRGEICYHQYCQLDAKLWQGHRMEDFRRMLNQISYLPGAREGVARIKAAGIRTAVISTGLNILAEKVCRELELDFCWANELGAQGEILTGEARIHVSADVQGQLKGDLARRLREELELKLAQVAAVGDSGGDLGLLAEAGRPILINPTPEDRDCISRRLPRVQEVSSWGEIPRLLGID
jgi:phosphoserine phosphatase